MFTRKIWLAALQFMVIIFLPFKLYAFQDIIFFGDSLTDVGNKGCFTNQAPTSNICPTWAYQIYQNFFHKPLLASNQGGSNFAVAGALSEDLLNQVNLYLQNHRPNEEILYTILIGNNDILDFTFAVFQHFFQMLSTHNKTGQPLKQMQSALSGYLLTLYAQRPLLIQAISNNIFKSIEALEANAGKNIVLLNLPTLNFLPIFNNLIEQTQNFCQEKYPTEGERCQRMVKSLSMEALAFNELTNAYLQAQIYVTTHVHFFNTALEVQQIFHSYSKYGFTNITIPCFNDTLFCQTATFWDVIHPTAAMHAQVSQRMMEFLKNTFHEPSYFRHS